MTTISICQRLKKGCSGQGSESFTEIEQASPGSDRIVAEQVEALRRLAFREPEVHVGSLPLPVAAILASNPAHKFRREQCLYQQSASGATLEHDRPKTNKAIRSLRCDDH
eukprot:3938853-Rhodomonas_salina.1